MTLPPDPPETELLPPTGPAQQDIVKGRRTIIGGGDYVEVEQDQNDRIGGYEPLEEED
jgi:hypothetical protein